MVGDIKYFAPPPSQIPQPQCGDSGSLCSWSLGKLQFHAWRPSLLHQIVHRNDLHSLTADLNFAVVRGHLGNLISR